ncbi:methyl-accepting chemotaxis protein [Bacillaceae bacterium S4-13-58]
MKQIKNLKFAAKINILVIGILVLFSVAIGFVIQNKVTDGVKEFAVAKAKSDLELGYATLDRNHPGSWSIVDDQLYKGDLKINENFEIVDHMAEITGGTVTIFQGDTRVTTNVKLDDGKRAIGTQASDQVIQQVLVKGENFYGEANVVGTMTQTAYQPIKDENGQIIGMWYVGVSQAFINDVIQSIMTNLIIVLVAGVIVATSVMFIFTHLIKKRLNRVNEALHKAGEGDFTTTLTDESTDEFGQLAQNFNKMRESLRSLVVQVSDVTETVRYRSDELNQSASEVKLGAHQIASTMQEMASGSEVQANNTSDLSAVMETFSANMQEANANGEDIYRASYEVLGMTEKGSRLMNESINQMNKVDHIVKDAVEKVQELDSQSQEISKLVSVIKDIADQTNLLALNAAIEAARAGEHGKGFAVVADEVRKLAEQVGHSVSDITSIVSNIQNGSSVVTESLKDGYAEVEKGTDQIKTTGQTFKEISNAVKEMAQKIQTISNNLSTMASKTQEMNASVEEIASVSEESAAGIEETSASAEQASSSMEEVAKGTNELSQTASELNSLVRQFKL